MGSPLKKPEGISWNAASIELPEIPMLPPGPDAMSATISAVLPTLAAQLTANVAALQAKEHTYSGKLGAAQAAYTSSDESGSQSVGQVVGMLGKLGEQAGQMAGAPAQAAQGGSGMFGSLIEQAMKAAQGGEGGAGGQAPAGGAHAGAAPGALPPGQQQPGRDPLEQRVERLEERAEAEDRPFEQPAAQREEREPLQRADDSNLASGPRDGASGAAPVAPPEQPRHAADEDLGRRL
ncbi:hypothetical protein [Mycobacterium neglectum]|uniref:hypothetical protein n=1 Tax=Mycobacterium neglectum TaxID=242737 RepID=UPI000BFEB1D6|nr:hypothetical protein [Mycobacterium neglectum]